jgi:hypothetical protein
MSRDLRDFVTGYFVDEDSAADAVQALLDAHFKVDDIAIVARYEGALEEVPVTRKLLIPQASAVGGSVGAALGAAGAALLATGILGAPGLALIATAPIVAAVGGGLLGAVGGGAAGAFVGMGFWRYEPVFAEIRRSGGILVGVQAAGDHRDEARAVLSRCGARHVEV